MILLVVAMTIAAGAAGVVLANASSPSQSPAQAEDPCFKIGRMRWCVRTTADEIAELVSPAAELTGYGAPTDTGPPPGVQSIRFNAPSAPGGQINCTNAGDHWECH
jgi:hypothetical protein